MFNLFCDFVGVEILVWAQRAAQGTLQTSNISQKYSRFNKDRSPELNFELKICPRAAFSVFAEKYGFVREGRTFIGKVWFRARGTRIS